jgi:hydroxymethylglutaryl-CoA synthase
MLTEIYALDSTPIALTGNEDVEYQNKLKEISKTEEYKNFIQQKLAEIASSLIGNLYTGSIFMGLVYFK